MTSKNDSHPLGIEPYAKLIKKTVSVDTDPIAAKLGLLMLWTSDNVLDAVDMDLASLGISESKLDFLLLFILREIELNEEEASMSPSAIANHLGITRASVTGLLDWMEKRALIVRYHYSEDRRRLKVKITPKGKELVFLSLPTFWSSCASLVDDFNQEERQILEKLLNKIQINMQSKVGEGR
ncbi:transcriptional regulator [Bacillus pseudomycoides]|uniref:MarR family winged helix-turn-helix transcriptional regulator n=1 Tax=Bacillus pseudomycoides TaxID=64104 RepID=UPI000BEE2034|nr:MarR family transcriptional regulator [Bacillus pseudomycoides]PDY47313.1 transcriptional regulator [Bacillus pseudomycoides]PED72111.1 transcriptional regulator [Bacillus pseudomycoides]PEI45599.1 transcriptional regulator [Bacillus pseudomycoides]PEJ77652.1 transcriptional regulator [Bacillus pseudomycoides]PEM11569.1 transcriptional regulator [Bacillus pseudomycoides]